MAVADVLETTIRTRAVFVGGVRGLNPPRKFLTPPPYRQLLLLKKRKGVDFLCT